MCNVAPQSDAGALSFANPGLMMIGGLTAPVAAAYGGVKLWKKHPVLGGIAGFLVGAQAWKMFAVTQLHEDDPSKL